MSTLQGVFDIKASNNAGVFVASSWQMPENVSSAVQKGMSALNGGTKGKYAWTVTVGTKGQIVLPKEAREVFDISPGDTLIILGDREKGMAIPLKSQFSDFHRRIFGQE